MATDNVDAKWVDRLGFVEFAINSSINSSTGKAPFELAYGTNVQQVVDHLDGMHSVAIAQDLVTSITKLIGEATKADDSRLRSNKQSTITDATNPSEFNVGDKVMLLTQNLNLTTNQKFKPRFIGPLKVTKRIGTQAYQLELPVAFSKVSNVVNVSLLRKYIVGGDGLVQYSQLSWIEKPNGK